MLRNEPPHHVHRSARQHRHDELDRPARVECRSRRERTDCEGGEPGGEGSREQPTDHMRLVWWFHSALTPASLAIACHFGTSRTIKAANSSGVPGLASAASFLKRSCISADCSPALISALSLPTLSLGVPAGAMTPVQELAMKSGTPPSIIVGTLGSSGSRAVRATPSAVTLPSCTWPKVTDVVSKPRSICPPMS